MSCRTAKAAPGFTLIELMVAMLLGLIVIGGVISVFVAGQKTYIANEALGDVSDGTRIAFELLTRDIRNAGLSGCDDTSGRIANVLNNGPSSSSTVAWYANWAIPIQGYDSASKDPALTGITGTGAPVAGTSSLQILSTVNTDVSVAAPSSTGGSTSFSTNAASTELAAGDIVMLCDYDHSTLMQIASISGTAVGFNATSTPAPGNCSTGLGYPTSCSGSGTTYTFQPNAHIGLLAADDWYIGTNAVATHSLYRLPVTYTATGVSVATPVEMVRNVTGMTINYLQSPSTASVGVMPGSNPGTAFVNATTVTNWASVYAAQVLLTVQSTNQRASVTGAAPISRSFTFTTTIRNRTP